MRNNNISRKDKYPLLPIDYQNINYTPQELWKRSVEYFNQCNKTGRPKTLSWLCLYCWIGKWFFNENKERQDFSVVIEVINLVLENYLEEQLLIWKNNNWIQFILTNRFKKDRIPQAKIQIEDSRESNPYHSVIRNILDNNLNKPIDQEYILNEMKIKRH